LLFVLALLLIVVGFKQLLTAVTAFTVAHSITLVLATLGVVHVPAAPTEAIIALSILFLATEIVHKHNGQFSLTEKYPWIVAFAFGLFHGLGFVVLSLFAVLKKLPFSVPQGAWRLLPYCIGSVAAFWTIERVVSFLPAAT
jgi:hypothetical protein